MIRQHRSWRGKRPGKLRGYTPGKSRQFQIESLEPRCVLAAPTLGSLPTNLLVAAGAPLQIALDGFDSDGDALSYSVTSTNPNLTGSIPKQDNPDGNRSMRISVAGFGDIEFELFEGRVPGATSRMIELAASRWYEGRSFHRIIPNFMIQGGSRDGLGINGTGTTFDDEFDPTLQFTSPGLLAMAKAGDDTNDSQFFVTDVPTRWLDFNHTIFGMLTAGEDVRQAIQAVPTDSSGKPLNPDDTPVIDSVTIFEDTQNAVLMLAAPEGVVTGDQEAEADVTITVSDGNGGTAQRTIHVTIEPDEKVDPVSNNSPPYLEPIDPVLTSIDTQQTFTLNTIDVEGDPVFYSAQVETRAQDMDIAVSNTGEVTVTPKNGQFGIFDITLRAGPSASSVALQNGRFNEGVHDAQTIPVFVRPPAPTIELLPVSDTGDLDGITSIDNSGKPKLRFMVSAVDSMATVEVQIDGVFHETTEIDRTPLDDGSGTDQVEVMVTDQLLEGSHSITARQTFPLGEEFGFMALEGEPSDPIGVTIDVQPPQIVSQAVLEAFVGEQYVYQVLGDDGPLDVLKYEIRDPKPDGITIDADTGLIAWTPQPSDAATFTLTVAAIDGAGLEGLQEFDLTVNSTIILQIDGDLSGDEGNTLSLLITAQDADDPSAPLAITLGDSTLPDGAAVSFNQVDDNTARFTWEITESDGPGNFQVDFHATTSGGTTRIETVQLVAQEVNLPPVLTKVYDDWQVADLFTLDEGQLLTLDFTATDPDIVPANDLVFSLVGNQHGEASIDPATGRFSFTPSEEQGGMDFAFLVRVTDAGELYGEQNLHDEATLHVSVEEVDSPPEFEPIELQVVSEGLEFEVQVTAADPDVPANQVRYSLVQGESPQGAVIDADSGRITWQVPENFRETRGSGDPVRLTVLATEVVPEGNQAQTATLAIDVLVVDDLEELIAASAVFQRGGSEPIGLGTPAPDVFKFLDGPAESEVNPITSPDGRTDGQFDNRGLFGTEFGTDGGGDRLPPKGKKEGDSREDLKNRQNAPQGEQGDGDGQQSKGSRLMLPPDAVGDEVADAAVDWLFDQPPVSDAEEDSTPEDTPPAEEHETTPREEGEWAAEIEELAVLRESRKVAAAAK